MGGGGRGKPEIFFFGFRISSLQSRALDNLATAPMIYQ